MPIIPLANHIVIKGARVHNLKNIDVTIPRNCLVVITGVSGSGKSSLTIDTLYAEGQRRYVESLSSYARQFLMRLDKPDVDYIKGISPAIAVEQKVVTRTSRSTVGSLTEIYDYLRLLFARIGLTYSPISGKVVRKHEVADVVDFVSQLPQNTRLQILIPLHLHEGRTLANELDLLVQKGYARLVVDGKTERIDQLNAAELSASKQPIYVLIDRLVADPDNDELPKRVADSVNTAFFESMGDCIVEVVGGEWHHFSNRFEADGMRFEEPNPQFFNFNSPYGACPHCEGFGTVIDIDEKLVFPDRQLSVYDNAIAPWRGDKMSAWRDRLVRNALHFDFPIHRSVEYLTEAEYQLLWTGNDYFEGLHEFFELVRRNNEKIQYRVMLARYQGRTACRHCKGSRLRPDAQYVRIDSHNITDLVLMPIKKLRQFFAALQPTQHQQEIAKRLFAEINTRLQVMDDMGLSYLTLNRLSNTLSGGETQRINLTRSLGSNLTNAMYILDEPSVGLHPRDTNRLIAVLKQLRNLGNTVLVVEHEEEMMRSADFLIDIGPYAGVHGGELVFAGAPDQLHTATNSLTADYLTGKKQITAPQQFRPMRNRLTIENATQHNLKDVTVSLPLNAITVVTGVSGSGKTTLIKNILHPALKRHTEKIGDAPGSHRTISGDIDQIQKIEMIDQNPLGRSSRSNPITYIKAYDSIRDLFSSLPLSELRGFEPKHFSFNVTGGRCEACEGDGEILVEMQFLSDVHLVCEECNGQRFKPDVLEVKYKDKSIFDVLDLSVDEALDFFADRKDIAPKIKPLADVGLGYIKLGQSSSTLSGGEAQRVKLASYLGKGKNQQHVLFIFDEPSTGLHFNDINKLLASFHALVEQGHSIVIVEHNLDIIKCADWVIDLGPEGGDEGGHLLFAGTPADLLACKESYTAQYLSERLQA